MIDTLIQYLLDFVGALDYFGIFFLMAVESSFIPFPSELVIPPAAFLAAQGEMNIFMVVLMGILGSLVGALVNYFLALHLGKPLVHKMVRSKWAKYFLLDEDKLKNAEEYFREYGSISTFVGRLVPAVRQLISIPAGFVRMNLAKFCLYTSLGAGVWIAILAGLGYYFGSQDNLMGYYYFKIFFLALGALVLAVIGGTIWKKKKRG
jgi:membrane protein DedA with SNARE-associated domain